MKLFLTWLLGVPLLVLAIVVARAMTPQGLEPRARVVAAASSPCVREGDLDQVGSPVVGNRHRITCERSTVQR